MKQSLILLCIYTLIGCNSNTEKEYEIILPKETTFKLNFDSKTGVLKIGQIKTSMLFDNYRKLIDSIYQVARIRYVTPENKDKIRILYSLDIGNNQILPFVPAISSTTDSTNQLGWYSMIFIDKYFGQKIESQYSDKTKFLEDSEKNLLNLLIKTLKEEPVKRGQSYYWCLTDSYVELKSTNSGLSLDITNDVNSEHCNFYIKFKK
jgi:hypothetical protein